MHCLRRRDLRQRRWSQRMHGVPGRLVLNVWGGPKHFVCVHAVLQRHVFHWLWNARLVNLCLVLGWQILYGQWA